MSKEAYKYLKQVSGENNDVLASIIKKNGQLDFPARHKTIADHLCHSIISQQLSKAAATSITNRVKDHLKIDEVVFSELNGDISFMRTCGVSGNKIKSIQAVLEQRDYLSSLNFKDEGLIIEELTKIWGVGKWTAEMAALFFYRFEDVWSWNDAALNRAVTHLIPDNGMQHHFVNAFKPYRSFLALHMWRAIDTKLI